MKISVYIKQKFQSFGIRLSEAELLDFALNTKLDIESEVSSENVQAIEKGMAALIPALLARPTSVNENGFSISWDAEDLKNYYAYLRDKYGLKDALSFSAISDATNLW